MPSSILSFPPSLYVYRGNRSPCCNFQSAGLRYRGASFFCSLSGWHQAFKLTLCCKMDNGIARSSFSAIYIFMHMWFEFEIKRPVRTMCTLSQSFAHCHGWHGYQGLEAASGVTQETHYQTWKSTQVHSYSMWIRYCSRRCGWWVVKCFEHLEVSECWRNWQVVCSHQDFGHCCAEASARYSRSNIAHRKQDF